MRGTLRIFLSVGVSMVLASVASADYKIRETQTRELPRTERIDIGIDSHYIRGRIVTVHIQAKKGLLEKNSAVSISCTLTRDGEEFGALTFNDNIEKDSGASYVVDSPFSPWLPYYGEDITVRFEVMEITRDDNLRKVVSSLSQPIGGPISLVPKAGMVFATVGPVIDQILRLRGVNNRLILKAKRTFSVPEQKIKGVLPLRYQHYIVFDNTGKAEDGITVYDYIEQNCELDTDGYLRDKKTGDIYRATTYMVFRFESRTQLLHERAQLKGREFYKYFQIGETLARKRNWEAVRDVGYELSRSIFETEGLLRQDRDFVMKEYERMASLHGYVETEHPWAYRSIVKKEKELSAASLQEVVENLEKGLDLEEAMPVLVEDLILKDKSVGGSFARYFTDKLKEALTKSSRFRLLEFASYRAQVQERGECLGHIGGIYWLFGKDVVVLLHLKGPNDRILASSSLLIPGGTLQEMALELLPSGYGEDLEKKLDVLTEDYKGISGLKIELWTDRGRQGVYREGENLVLYFLSNQDCFVKLFYFDATGDIIQIFPNRYYPSGRVQAGAVHRIPAVDDSFQLRIQPPFGVETVKAFASTASLDRISVSFFEDAAPGTALENIRGIGIAPAGGYAEASVIITTVDSEQPTASRTSDIQEVRT